MIDYKIVDNVLEVLDSKGKKYRSLKIIPLKYVYSIEISDDSISFFMPNNVVNSISIVNGGFNILDIYAIEIFDGIYEKTIDCFKEFAEDVKTKWLEYVNE